MKLIILIRIFVDGLVGRCDPVPQMPFATPNSNNATSGSVVHYQCDLGYKPAQQPQGYNLCSDGNWISIELQNCVG